MKKVLLIAVLTITLGVLLGSVFAPDSSAFMRGRGHSTWYGMGWWGMMPYCGYGWYGCGPAYCGPAWCGPCGPCGVVKAKAKGKPAEKKMKK